MNNSTENEWRSVSYKKNSRTNNNNNPKNVPTKQKYSDYVESWDRELATPLKYKCKKIEYE